MGDISASSKSLVVQKSLGPITSGNKLLHQTNSHGMVVWQSRLQEKLMQEAKEKREKDKMLSTQKLYHLGELDKQSPKSTFHFPKISSSKSYTNLTTMRKPSAYQREGMDIQNPIQNVPAISNAVVSTTKLGVEPFLPQQHYGGCGAPRRTPSGRLLTVLQGHPDIRYHQQNTRTFDQNIRYLEDKEKILNYKQELDKQIAEKRSLEDRERYKSSRRNSRNGGGMELASLLRSKYYSQSLPKLNQSYSLGSTDVTRPSGLSPRTVQYYYQTPSVGFRSGGQEHDKREEGSIALNTQPEQFNRYAQILNQQLVLKRQRQENERFMDTAQSQQHFLTWDSFWGRPGHGAPVNYFTDDQNKRGDLWKLLHYASVPKK